jgi:transcriptional regulator with XRE-family HTH domain
MKLGEAIKYARISLDLTQEEVAERVSISRSQVANLELGRGGPTTETLAELAKALKCWFLTDGKNWMVGFK